MDKELNHHTGQLWRDPSQPSAARVEDLLARMTLPEKIAQLYSVWLGANGPAEEVAPLQHELVSSKFDWQSLLASGLGQLTRVLGTAPMTPADASHKLAELQASVVAAGRFGIPAIAHEECLNGFTTLGATIFPTPLAWGATFDPALVERMAAHIGNTMRQCGIHQGLAPVLDVTRDARWGRTEETIGEDPYLVATIGTAYVRGLQSGGVIATLKHFAGYSASRAGRNFAPVSMGRREFHDVILFPFEMAVREGGARSVMHSYAEVDGVPAAADATLLTGVLRDTWGFTGTVVADYFGVSFLHTLHHVAEDSGDAAHKALAAGVDVELPSVHCFGEPLLDLVKAGTVPESLIDRACRRVLLQKCQLGLLDPHWTSAPDGGLTELDLPQGRALARELADESVVLLSNDGTLPLPSNGRIAVIGPLADDPFGMLGCYTFPSHLGLADLGVAVPTVLDSLRDRLPGATITHAPGCTVSDESPGGLDEAIALAREADVCVVVLGDRAGMFGKGTSGEGCDVTGLDLPGLQGELLERACSLRTRIILVLLSGRPYALGRFADRCAAIVQTFFPGEEGGPAVASVLTGLTNPSGRLPVSVPRVPDGQPWTYLSPTLGHATDVSSVDPTPQFPFGHGLSYTTFDWAYDLSEAECSTSGTVSFGVTVRNTGSCAGTEVVQIYLHDPVAQVTRPVAKLIGYARLTVSPGEARRAEFTFHADLAAFTGRDFERIVEPGEVHLRIGASSQDIRHTVRIGLTGPQRPAGHDRQLTMGVAVADGPLLG